MGKRLCFINRVMPPAAGATGYKLYDLVRHLGGVMPKRQAGERKQVLEIDVICGHSTRPDPEDDPYLPDGVTRHHAPLAGQSRLHTWLYPLAFMALIWRAMTIRRPDAFVVMTDPPLLHWGMVLVSKLRSVPMILWSQDVYPEMFTIVSRHIPAFMVPWLVAINTRLLQHFDSLVVISDDMRKYFISQGIPAQRIHLIPNWPAEAEQNAKLTLPHRYHPEPQGHLDPKKAQPRQRPEQRSMRLLYSGTLGRAHPFEPLLMLWEAIYKHETSALGDHLTLQVQGRHLPQCQKLIAESHIPQVILHPPMPEHRYINNLLDADIHVVTLDPRIEGWLWPSKIETALALGRPCLVIGGVRIPEAIAGLVEKDIILWLDEYRLLHENTVAKVMRWLHLWRVMPDKTFAKESARIRKEFGVWHVSEAAKLWREQVLTEIL